MVHRTAVAGRAQKKAKRVGAFFVTPILFMLLGYLIFYFAGRPVIQFTTSSLELFLLNRKPTFHAIPKSLWQSEGPVDLTEVKQMLSESQAQGVDILQSSELTYPKTGEQFGVITIEKLDIETPLYLGDEPEILRVGSGQSLRSSFPGESGGALIGGHTGQDFEKLQGIQTGDRIEVDTLYGSYVYEVTGSQIKRFDDESAIEVIYDRTKRSLVLYTCYPTETIGVKHDRLFVYADLISGPIIE